MRTPIAFIFGALAATLVAAAAFRGSGQPLESTFTYQGQLRNAGQLVNGNVDVRFTLWDSDVGGTQIGNANSFTNYPLTDGRFALGLNFGTGAFNGDQRWVQVEFRNPAGSGQYLTLAPRDKILAAPYALYALNSTASQWDYNPKTQALTSAQNVAKVGIGTNAPTAALEVVAAGGDDAVKLPAGSIGIAELSTGVGAKTWNFEGNPIQVVVPATGVLLINGIYATGTLPVSMQVGDLVIPLKQFGGGSYEGPMLTLNRSMAVDPGTYTVALTQQASPAATSFTVTWLPLATHVP
jgi:hypothetical protein